MTAKPGDDLTKVRKAVDEEIAKVLKDGPTQTELDRIRTAWFARFVRGAERIGGFGGKSDILAQSVVYNGSPDAYKKTLQWVAGATPADIKRVANQWLADGVYDLGVVERSDLTGFNWSNVPAVLIEAGFMTNPRERRLLQSSAYELKVARGIAAGTIAFVGKP